MILCVWVVDGCSPHVEWAWWRYCSAISESWKKSNSTALACTTWMYAFRSGSIESNNIHQCRLYEYTPLLEGPNVFILNEFTRYFIFIYIIYYIHIYSCMYIVEVNEKVYFSVCTNECMCFCDGLLDWIVVCSAECLNLIWRTNDVIRSVTKMFFVCEFGWCRCMRSFRGGWK